MRAYIVIFLCLVSSFCAAQSLVIGVGIDGTSRLKSFHQSNFSDEEFESLKKLEGMRASYAAHIAYFFNYSDKLDMSIGLGYRMLRFGSKKYEVSFNDLKNDFTRHPPIFPTGLDAHERHPNEKLKDIINQHQFNLGVQLYFKHIKPLKSTFFVHPKIIYNHNTYKVFIVDRSTPEMRAIYTEFQSPSYKHHTLDAYVSTGLSWKLFSKNFLVEPHVGMYLLPYSTNNENRHYLNLEKDVKGFLWDVGIRLGYKINLKKQQESDK